MKCYKHNTDAVGICAWCGRAVCSDCLAGPPAARVTCSGNCGANLERQENVLRALLDRNTRNARASACYCYLTGGLSAAAALMAWFILPSPFLMYFTGACALVLFIAGFRYGRAAQ